MVGSDYKPYKLYTVTPRYSPEFNLVELTINKTKTLLKGEYLRPIDYHNLDVAVYEAIIVSHC